MTSAQAASIASVIARLSRAVATAWAGFGLMTRTTKLVATSVVAKQIEEEPVASRTTRISWGWRPSAVKWWCNVAQLMVVCSIVIDRETAAPGATQATVTLATATSTPTKNL